MAEAAPRRQSFLVGALALALAGCSTVVPRSHAPTNAPAPPPPAATTTPASPNALPEDRERHRVALLVPLTGPAAAVGRSIADAASLALVDTGGTALRITTYDTAAGGAQGAAQKALADGNGLILGPLLADDVRAAAGTAQAAGVPVIAFSNDASVIGDDVWLLGFSPAQSIERVVRYAKSRGLTRFAGMIPQGVYGRSAAGTLIHAAEAAGGSVVAMQTFSRTPKSIADAVAALSKQKYDAVLIADSGRVAVATASLVRKRGGMAARLLGTELWNAEPGLNASPVMKGAWFASVDDANFRRFVTRYKARYEGRTPYRLASLGYDGVLLAARIAKDWKIGAPFPVERLNDEGGFAGVDGAFRFSGGHVAERALAVHQVGPEGGTVVSPAPTSF